MAKGENTLGRLNEVLFAELERGARARMTFAPTMAKWTDCPRRAFAGLAYREKSARKAFRW